MLEALKMNFFVFYRWTRVAKREDCRRFNKFLRVQIHLLRTVDNDGAAQEGVESHEARKHKGHQGFTRGKIVFDLCFLTQTQYWIKGEAWGRAYPPYPPPPAVKTVKENDGHEC